MTRILRYHGWLAAALVACGASAHAPRLIAAPPVASPVAPSRPVGRTSAFENLRQDPAVFSERLPSTTDEPRPPAENSTLPTPAEAVAPGRETGDRWTLAQIEQLTMANNPALREAVAQATEAAGRAVQAGLYPNPVVASASPQWAGSISQYNVFVSQDIVTKGKLRLDSDAAWRAAREAELQVVSTRFQVLTAARQQYAVVLAAQMRRDELRRLVAISAQSAKTGKSLLDAGQWSRGDVIPLEIEYERAQLLLDNATTLLAAGQRQLAAALGLPLVIVPPIAGDFSQPLPEYDQWALARGVVTRNALAQAAAIEIGRSEVLLRRAEVEPFPNVNFMGGYQFSLQPPDQQQGLYQVTMAVPLWNRNQGNIRAAQANVSEAVAAQRRVQTELAGQTAAALGRFLTARQAVERYGRVKSRAQELYDQGQQLKREGEVDLLRVLLAQRTLFEANLDYISALERMWTAAAEVAGLLQAEQFP